jgi:3-oxoacyl-[acyl-carrier protein] reductase
MRFQDRVAVITAAGSGIGRATAEIIGSEGGVVVGVDTDKVRLGEVVDGIRLGGGRAEAQVTDALEGSQVTAAVDAVVRAHGRIDILVNAVGGSTIIGRAAAAADELTLEEWHRVITFNLDGTFLFCRAVVPVMKRQRSGKIIAPPSICEGGSQFSVPGALPGGARERREPPRSRDEQSPCWPGGAARTGG